MKPIFSLKELEKITHHWLDMSKPVLYVAGPGVGKSEFLQGIAKERKSDYFTLPAAGLVPSHLTGYQFPDKVTYVSLSEKILSHKANKKELIIHLQDFIQAPATIQALLMNIVLTRQINNQDISKNVKFVLDTNRPEDNAGGASIIEPFKSRAAIAEFPVDVNGWLTWGIQSKRIDIKTLCFIKAFPEQLYRFKPSRSVESYPCPRTWEKASQDVSGGFISIPALAAHLGYETATDFSLFLNHFDEFIGFIDTVIASPLSATKFTDLDKRYYACSLLANKMSKANIKPFIQYLKRYNNKELMTFTMELAGSIHPSIKETKEYQSLFID